MSLKDTFRELAIKNAPKQTELVDGITERNPILAGLPMEPSSGGAWHVYEKVTDITGAGLVDMDSALPTISANTDLDKVNLSLFGGTIKIGEDKASQLGLEAYIAKQMPKILTKTGNNIEKSMFYNNFRSFAFDNKKLVSAGGSVNTNYTMLCVTYRPGEMTGLYSESDFGRGEVFDMKWLNNGALHDIGSGVNGYAMRIKSYFGIQMANPKLIAGIVNNDIANDATGSQHLQQKL